MKYSAVLFDMDGVILDSEPLHEAAFRSTLEAYGHALSETAYAQHFAGRSDKDGLELYFQFINEEADIPKLISLKAEAFLNIANDQLQPYPGVISVIEELSKELPLALVTGSLRFEAEIALEKLGIHKCFRVIVAAEDVSKGKPSPEGYLKAASLLKVPIGECAVIEDSVSGVKAAISSGADCIAVTNTHTADELKLATKVVDKLAITLL